MKLKYSMDISEKSTWFVNTPTDVAKRLPFFINEYGHYIACSSYFTERQEQKNYLLIYTLSGKGLLNYCGKEYVLGANQAVMIHCVPYHMYKTFPGDLWDFRWFHFNGTSAKEYFHLMNPDALSIITVSDPLGFQKMLDELFSSFTVNDISANVRISRITVDIISYLIVSKFVPAENKKHAEHRKDIERLILYIQRNYSSKLSMEDLSKTACMSKYYLIRLFKSHTGVSPYDFIKNFRINKAKELLKTTEYSVGEICTLTGFNDYCHFIRQFREVVGVTPLKYRFLS